MLWVHKDEGIAEMRINTEVTEAQRQQYAANREICAADKDLYTAAYALAVARYNFRAAQRDRLDASPYYAKLLQAVARGRWTVADAVVVQAGLARSANKASSPRSCEPCNCGCEY